jgi:4-diphosphocytidyl-2-C-methyl-D-erythritol kinase
MVTFGFGVSTADAFGWWDDDGGPTGPDPEPVVGAASQGIPEALGPIVYNDLEDAVTRRHPVLAEAKQRLLEAGAVGVVMCGSGPTLAAILPTDGRFEPPAGLSTQLISTVGD